MPAKKKPEQLSFVKDTCQAFISRLSSGGMLSDKEVALFVTLLQTVDNQTLQQTIGERMEGWERRLADTERLLESRASIAQAMSGRHAAPHQGPPNLNPLDGNHRR